MATPAKRPTRAKKAPQTLEGARNAFFAMIGEKLSKLSGRADRVDETLEAHDATLQEVDRRLVNLESNPSELDTIQFVMGQIKDL